MRESENESMMTPINLVRVIPLKTELPISTRALLALSLCVPVERRKARVMWTQNSTLIPIAMTKFTTLSELK